MTPLYRSNTRKYKTRKWISPYDEVEGIVRGLFLFYDRLITFQKNPKRRLWFY